MSTMYFLHGMYNSKTLNLGKNSLEILMALEANRKDTTQTRGLVIFISNIFGTYFVYSKKVSYNILP